MKLIRCIICDDEAHARSRLRKRILVNENFIIIAECNNGVDSLEQIRELKPDLVFLDIQMPDLTGIDVLKKLSGESLPQIIFVTAYDKHAIKAFELCALDYILKPYENKRIEQALERVLAIQTEKEKQKLSENLLSLIQEYENQNSDYLLYLKLREKEKDINIDCRDIYFLQAFSNYIEINLKDKKYLHRISLAEIEERFNPDHFLRIHRSYVINKSHVKTLKYLGNNEYEFELINAVKLKSGRHYSKKIAAL